MSKVDARNAVIVLLDCMEGTAKKVLEDEGVRKSFVQSAKDLITLGKRHDIPVVRVEVEFRPGHPEVAASNAFFSGAKAAGRLVAGSDQTVPMAEFSDEFADTLRVSKRRIGAFAGSDLEWVLRGLGRSHLILAGLVTRGAVLSTACYAADRDYQVTVATDACHDPDPAVHRMLTTSVLPLRATVMSAGELEAAIGA